MTPGTVKTLPGKIAKITSTKILANFKSFPPPKLTIEPENLASGYLNAYEPERVLLQFPII